MTGPGSYNRLVEQERGSRVEQFKSVRGTTTAADFARSIGVDKNVFYKWCREFGIKLRKGRYR